MVRLYQMTRNGYAGIPLMRLFLKIMSRSGNTVRKTYTATFKELVTGGLPREEAILATLKFLAGRIAQVSLHVRK